MNVLLRSVVVAACACSGSMATADIIPVVPGNNTIAAAAAKAKDGDTIKLEPGVYTGSVELSEGVRLEGVGADKTTLVATAYAAVNCKGPRTTIAGITIKPGEQTTRGVNTSTSVRVERCRFERVKEGVAMMAAPLSDVVACEFVDCGIGVRAIGGACPTVWGCLFSGGGMGVFAMDGMPYIRNNLFRGQRAGIRMAVGSEQSIIRNNLFLECKDAGIELLTQKETIFGPVIRNNLFGTCGAAATGDDKLLRSASHCLLHVTPPGDLDLGKDAINDADAGVAVTGSTITLAHRDRVEGKGIKAPGEAEGTTAWIGPEQPWWTLGSSATAELPPVRFEPPDLVANAVREEYQYLDLRKLSMGQQSTGGKNGRQYDNLSCSENGKPVKLTFDITRFYGEMSIKP